MSLEALYELDEMDGRAAGDPVAVFAEGQHDKKRFAIACNQEFNLAEAEKFVAVKHVKYVWAKKVFYSESSDEWSFHITGQGSPGSFFATYAEVSDFYFKDELKNKGTA